MARVLFINGGSEGHINPTLGVVQELVARREEVVYICIEAFRERVEKAGASVLTFDGQKFIQAFVSGGREAVQERVNGLLLTADVILPRVLEQIKGQRFDYILHDSMFGCGRLFAQILKLPAISSCTTFVQTEEAFGGMLDQSLRRLPSERAQSIQDTFLRLTAGGKERYKVEIHSPYEVFCNPAPLTLVYTTKEFQPDGEAFGEEYAFVGPSIAPRHSREDALFAELKGTSLIYISLGTVFNQAVGFYKLCLQALGDTEHTVVLSIGDKVAVADLGAIPGNFMVRQSVAQTEILRHTKLFITHGGMNSVHEGLYNGVPMIVIPQSADQPVIAGQAAKVGAGLPLHMQSLTAGQLRQAVDEVLSRPSFREAAAAMRESFRSSGGARQAVNEIFRFKERHRI
ncbi:macrolide family glycosyltransferase [Paenibacillus sp. YN15]|uniref:macrolide family glycosyltransferase n=1 Tax=Paenibacillus sp. YN15 TaxID=1742774 RepID=UPI000DCD4F5F|nr:macrolide family glycosyltransferase [Paenibacillus sp. YN15]RAV00235.1 glycosyl transferase family 1 [Paenibacillus sp. YN15]